MNQSNAPHGDKPSESPREWNKQTTEVHFKSCTPAPKSSLVVSAIMGRLSHHAVDNGNLEVYPSYHPSEYPSDSVPEPDSTTIKSIDDDKMYQLLE